MTLAMSVTWTTGAPVLTVEAGTLTTQPQVTALIADLKKVQRLLPDRLKRSAKKAKPKSSRPTASKPRKAKASASGDTAAAQAPAE